MLAGHRSDPPTAINVRYYCGLTYAHPRFGGEYLRDVRKDKQAERVVLVNESNRKDWRQDLHFIEAARIEKDALHLRISYTGGCAEHDFSLVAWDSSSKASILQAKLLLAHNANGDSCKAIIKETLRFDVSPLRAHFHEIYGPELGIVLLCLRDLRVRYYM